jgi:hypothetical protein
MANVAPPEVTMVAWQRWQIRTTFITTKNAVVLFIRAGWLRLLFILGKARYASVTAVETSSVMVNVAIVNCRVGLSLGRLS